jgi:putative PIN family toxin of toxin-antitoxin system
MRAVVDTNVLISACLKADSSPRHVIRWVQQRGIFLKSNATETEFHLTLGKPKLVRLLHDLAFVEYLTALMHTAQLVPVAGDLRACRDPDDDKFLELAVLGRADVIVSGDADLLALDPFHGIPIIDPATFARRHKVASQNL